MADRKIKWLMYTVLVGLIPAIFRLLVWAISRDHSMGLFSAADFVVFGLILHISNINEIEHFNDSHKSWKTIQNGISILFIAVYGLLFATYLLGESNPDLIQTDVVRYIAICLSVVSFALSFSVYNRLSILSRAA